MGSNKVLAVLAGWVTIFVLGYLVYGMLMADFFAANAGTATGVMKDPPDLIMIGLGELVSAVFLVVVLGWAGVTDAAAGFQKGALIGLLLSASVGFVWLGAFNISTMTGTLADVVVSAVRIGIGGAVIGAMLGRGGGGEAAAG